MYDYNPTALTELHDRVAKDSTVSDLQAGIDFQQCFPWPLNNEQLETVQKLVKFLTDPNPESRYFVMSGSAGTGKTSLMEGINKIFQHSSAAFAYTAPTNKAAKVLAKRVGMAKTIYSLLGLRLEKNGEVKELTDAPVDIDLSDINAVIVDEASMVNSVLMKHIEKAVKKHNLRIVFLGDKYQLPPVGEAKSIVFDLPFDAQLLKVERHDNAILDLAVHVRDQVFSPITNITVKTQPDIDGGGVFKLDKMAFKRKIMELSRQGDFHQFDKAKVVAWTNAEVNNYNNLIREGFFGGAWAASPFMVNDRIVATEPVTRGQEQIMCNGDEAIVLEIIETRSSLAPEYKALELVVRTEDENIVRLLVLHPDSKKDFDNACEKLAAAAKAKPGRLAWKAFWDLKSGIFDSVTYAYASTAHKAQGSTYETCFVDMGNILKNRNRTEALQCLYVAVSRASSSLFIS